MNYKSLKVSKYPGPLFVCYSLLLSSCSLLRQFILFYNMYFLLKIYSLCLPLYVIRVST